MNTKELHTWSVTDELAKPSTAACAAASRAGTSLGSKGRACAPRAARQAAALARALPRTERCISLDADTTAGRTCRNGLGWLLPKAVPRVLRAIRTACLVDGLSCLLPSPTYKKSLMTAVWEGDCTEVRGLLHPLKLS